MNLNLVCFGNSYFCWTIGRHTVFFFFFFVLLTLLPFAFPVLQPTINAKQISVRHSDPDNNSFLLLVTCSFNLQDLPPERAFADFVLCNLVLHLVIMNFLG